MASVSKEKYNDIKSQLDSAKHKLKQCEKDCANKDKEIEKLQRGKKKRTTTHRSAYQLFLKQRLPQLTQQYPNKPQPERFKMAVTEWKSRKFM